MESSVDVVFSPHQTAHLVRITEMGDRMAALDQLALPYPRPVLVLVGGASRLSTTDRLQVRSLFVKVLAPLAEILQAVVVDGGTDTGIMQMMGRARTRIHATFPLLGVAPVGVVALPNQPLPVDGAYLEPHHTHFILVPGTHWGDESDWMAHLATAIAGEEPSVTILINGGEVSWIDAHENVAEGRPVIAIAGSGRTADALATALQGKITDERARRIVDSGLLQAIHLRSSEQLTQVIEQILSR